MKNTAVIFPDTESRDQVLTPLVLVFEPVVYCQPIENDSSQEALSPLCKTLVDKSLCDFHAPAPLAEHRERFLKLVYDLRNRPDDYASQLTHVSLAGISSGSQAGTETKGSILTNLLSGHGIEGASQELIEKLLWQARLILKLGEQFDADQQEMAENVSLVQQREQKMFSGMVQEEESPFSLTGKLTSLTADTSRLQRLRLKAWARLLAFGSSPLPGTAFISTDPDAVDRLCEEYERNKGSLPGKIGVLALPVISGKEEFVERLQSFKEGEAELLRELSLVLEKHGDIDAKMANQWNVAVENSFPASDYGRCQLIMYTFSNVRTKHIFLDSFGHDEDGLEARLSNDSPHDILIGLLAPFGR